MQDADLDQPQLARPGAIKIHRPEDFEGMRKAGRIAAQALDMIAEHVKPGVATITTQFTGVFKEDPAQQARFMQLALDRGRS